MPRSSNAMPRFAALLIAGATLAGQAAQAGMIVLENHLPVSASCVVETRFGTGFDVNGLGVLQELELLDAQLVPSSIHIVPVAPGDWPAQLRFDRFGTPYTASPPFIDLELTCRVGNSVHTAIFANPDFWDEAGEDRSDDSTFSRGRERFQDTYALPSFTPTDSTAFFARLVPEAARSTPAQLLRGAPVAVEIGAMPLLADGAPLHGEPRWIGRYKMVPPQPIDDSSLSGSQDSGSESHGDPGRSR